MRFTTSSRVSRTSSYNLPAEVRIVDAMQCGDCDGVCAAKGSVENCASQLDWHRESA